MKIMFDSDDITVNDSNHSITMTDIDEDDLDEEDIAEMLEGGYQINQKGTKVRIPAGTMDPEQPELIMTKQ
jgi:polyribonucleotide nucleotidyltransferase